jgi:hypothetical protein
MKSYSYNSNVQTFNIILVDVHNSLFLILDFMPISCLIIIIGDFNIDMLIKTQHNQRIKK